MYCTDSENRAGPEWVVDDDGGFIQRACPSEGSEDRLSISVDAGPSMPQIENQSNAGLRCGVGDAVRAVSSDAPGTPLFHASFA